MTFPEIETTLDIIGPAYIVFEKNIYRTKSVFHVHNFYLLISFENVQYVEQLSENK